MRKKKTATSRKVRKPETRPASAKSKAKGEALKTSLAIESPDPTKLVIYNSSGSKVGETASIFGETINQQLLAQAVSMYLANIRKGLASTKTRGEVSGGGKKPWRQKGTGRARVGSIRSPLWRHGGVVFGPHKRDFSYHISARLRNAALLNAFNEKNCEGKILVLESLQADSPKTKELVSVLDKLNAKESVLLVVSKHQENLQKASHNIPHLTLAEARNINALDVLRNKKIILLKDCLGIIRERLNPQDSGNKKQDEKQ